MDYAIRLQRIDLGDDRSLFKTIGLIKGQYNNAEEIFIDEFGYEYDFISNSGTYDDRCFSAPTSIEELRKPFEGQLTDEEILQEFLSMYMDVFYLGYYDAMENTIKFKEINFDDVEKAIDNSENLCFEDQSADVVEFVIQDNEKVVLSLQTLQELKKYKTVEEIRNYIDSLIDDANCVNDLLEKTETKNKRVAEKRNLKLKRDESSKFNLKEMREVILQDIIEQDKAVYDITREIMINETSLNYRNKSHMLVTGPTGTGKTEIISKISKILDKSFFVADATAYTKEGYVGKSVYSMLLGLLDAANGNLEKAQNGILVIDEIDKKLSERKDDVSGLTVLHSLLKIADRGVVELDKGYAGYRNTILFDTSNLTIIFMGAFEDIYTKKLKQNNNSIGFIAERKEITKKEIVITKNDLLEAGFPAELLGRIGGITSTYAFDEDGLVKLLTKSKISALLILKEYLKESFGIELRYTAGFVREIAKKAIKTGTNARELKPLVREATQEALEEIFSGHRAKVLRLTKETAINNKKYYFE